MRPPLRLFLIGLAVLLPAAAKRKTDDVTALEVPNSPPGPELWCNYKPSGTSSGGESCPYGCADWAHLQADGNTRSQADVDNKWLNAASPDSTCCAEPGKDTQQGPWCYCKGVNSNAYQWCVEA